MVVAKKVGNSGKNKYQSDHSDMRLFKEESDKRYCKEGMELEGVGCALCQITFGPGFAEPRVKSPIYVYYGITLYNFLFVV